MRGEPLARPAGTLVEALVAAATGRYGVTFVGPDEHELFHRWSSVLERGRRAAATYARLGVRPGHRVALVLHGGPAYLDAFLGAWLAAAVPVPLPPPGRLGHLDDYLAALERMVRSSGADLIVSGGTTLSLLGRVVHRVRPRLGCIAAADLEEVPARIHRPVGPGDVGLVQFAWGGGAAARPVAFTHGALAAQVAARVASLGLERDDAIASWLSLTHDSGLVGALLTALGRGCSLTHVASRAVAERPAVGLRAVARHRATVAVGPASSFGRAAAAPPEELARCDLSSLRLVVARHEPGDVPALRAVLERLGPLGLEPAALAPCWGLAELPFTAAASASGQGLVVARVDAARLARDGQVVAGARELAAVGRPLPGVDVDVRDEAGQPLPPGRLGRLWLRAPAQLEGTEAIGPHGWLDSGDTGFTLDGALYVHGRRDELVLVQGARHAPEEFELPLAGLDGVGAVVALTLPQPQGQPGALLVLVERAEGGHPERVEATVRRTLLDRAGVVPHTVALLPPGALPRTGSGRLRRGEALRRWLAGTLAPPRSVNPVRLAVDAARSQLAWARLRLGG